ncbi:MAG: hypothetical protein RLZZ263_1447 [Cyanobacteriota bacterium]|jgi:uncharacterized membrane protein YccC
MQRQPLITRVDLRMALTAGLSAGLVISLGLPDPFYGPMAVGAVLGGTLGASRTLGIQRMLGTILGGLIVVIGYPTMGAILPLPLAVGVALAATRLFGGSLGLRSGYKVAGLVVAVGWTVHSRELFSWLPARLVVTLVGVLLAWLAVSQFWPSRALEQRQQLSRQLFTDFAEAFRDRAQRLGLGEEVRATNRLDRRDQLLAKILALQANRVDARTELQSDGLGQRLGRLWDLQEQLLSELIAIYRTLLRLPMVPMAGSSLQALLAAEVAALAAAADWLELWASSWPDAPGALARQGPRPAAEDLARAIQVLEQAELGVFGDPQANATLMAGSGGRRAVACQQLLLALQRFGQDWQSVP